MRAIAILFLLLPILGCQSSKSSPMQAWQEQVHAYLNTYQQRDDFTSLWHFMLKTPCLRTWCMVIALRESLRSAIFCLAK